MLAFTMLGIKFSIFLQLTLGVTFGCNIRHCTSHVFLDDKMCGSRKYCIFIFPWKVLGNSEGVGGLISQSLKQMFIFF